jgi:pSer/pThr/pTyr-binding forkhead associated (FHA) protein
MKPPDPHDRPAVPPRNVTMVESIDEIRAQIRGRQTMKEPIPSTFAQATSPPVSFAQAPSQAAAVDDTARFQPVHRPATAALIIFDDGDDEGETVRIRRESFIIGRVQGDLVIAHDGNISGKHAEIVRRLEGGRWHWYLRDLQSTNGTFVRVAGGILRDGQEILIGGNCYRFESSHIDDSSATSAEPGAPAATRKFAGGSIAQVAAQMSPALVALTSDGDGRRFALDRAEQWVGRDPAQSSIVLEDPLVSPRHARIYRDPKGKWMIQNNRSLNGIWMRITEASLEKGGQFQCGEQRFQLKLS